MHAYIITGLSVNNRNKIIEELLTDRTITAYDVITMVPDGLSIGIDAIRPLASQLSLHPVASPTHAVIIHNAHVLTQEAQNAMLKLLEEPPGEALIILETPQPDALLPTILSRCHTIRLTAIHPAGRDESLQCLATIKNLTQSSVGKKLQIIDTIAKTRKDALAFVDEAITAIRQDLVITHSHANLLRALLAARTHILGNIAPKLALDNVFLYNGS